MRNRHRAVQVLGAEAVLDHVTAEDVEARLVDRNGRAVVLEVRERIKHDRRGHPLGSRHEHDLVGPLDREPRERAGHAGAEVEQHDVVERRTETRRARRSAPARGSRSARRRRAPRAHAARSAAARRTGRARPRCCSRSASSSRSASERSDRRSSGASRASVPKSGLASTAIARSFRWVASRLPDHERAGRLAHATLRADQRDRVRARDARTRADPPLEIRFLALRPGRRAAAACWRRNRPGGPVRRRPPVHERRRDRRRGA